jgi:excisionase family DNA binding protein
MDATSQDWVPLGEGARRLGVSEGTLRRWADNGRLPVFRTPTGQRRFKIADLDELMSREPQPANGAA